MDWGTSSALQHNKDGNKALGIAKAILAVLPACWPVGVCSPGTVSSAFQGCG
jgi:hypothetical protein